jgi:phospholipid/cholesterol/gamma-HCH transport system substrate-binding protein
MAVGNVTKIERQGWHALVTMSLPGSVHLPGNATATLGQTSLLGSLHIELASPKDVPPEGTLRNGSLIPLSSAGAYPSTEKTLGAVSLLLNGGGVSQLQDITEALSTAFSGRGDELRSLIGQLDKFTAYLNDQKDDILAATDSLNNLVGQFADQKPVVDKALKTIPDALAVLRDERQNLADALGQVGKFSACGRLGKPDQGKPGQGAERSRSSAAITGRCWTGIDPFTGLLLNLPVPQANPRKMEPGRLCELNRCLRLDAEPA